MTLCTGTAESDVEVGGSIEWGWLAAVGGLAG
jgi:hypothetical protein